MTWPEGDQERLEDELHEYHRERKMFHAWIRARAEEERYKLLNKTTHVPIGPGAALEISVFADDGRNGTIRYDDIDKRWGWVVNGTESPLCGVDASPGEAVTTLLLRLGLITERK